MSALYSISGDNITNVLTSGTVSNASYGNFPLYNITTFDFEKQNNLGYSINSVDIATISKITAKYTNYTSNTTINSSDIPAWCSQIRFIAIGGGGGGGGGGGDGGSDAVGGGGSGGGGGGLAAAYVNIYDYPPPYNLTIGSGGNGGELQEDNYTGGNPGAMGGNSIVKYLTNITLITAFGGTGGKGGPDPEASNESVSGVAGGSGTILSGFSGTSYTNTGNSSGFSGRNNGSDGGTVVYGASVPNIATNVTVTNTHATNHPYLSNWGDLLAGTGQGGHGGINTDAGSLNRGNAGQPGGNGIIRAYFIK